MGFLKKRSVAVIITVIIVLAFSLIGMRLSVNRSAAKIEKMFYNGVDGETAIQTYLDNLFKESKTVYSIASKYLDDNTTYPFRKAYNDLYDADNIPEKYDSYAALLEEAKKLEKNMEGVQATEKEREYYNDHMKAIKNIQRMINDSSYNEKVNEFEQRVLNRFPVSVLRRLAHPNTPEYFR